MNLQDGIFRLSYEAYAKIPALNWSTLKELESQSLYSFKKTVLENKEKEIAPALEFGSAFHLAILEPHRFQSGIKVMSSANGNAERRKLKEAHKECAIISKSELTEIELMSASLKANESFDKYLTGGHAEAVMIWTCPTTGQRCKARLDYINSEFITDVKTTAEPLHKWSDAAFRYGYLSQAAWYVWGYTILTRRSTNFVFAVASKNHPYENTFVTINDQQLDYGHQVAQSLLTAYHTASQSDTWPRIEGEQEFNPSPWVKKQINELQIKQILGE